MEQCIIQEFIPGVPISTSLLVNNDFILPISINHQNLRIQSQRSVGHYVGGEVPYNIPKYHDEIIETSVKLVRKMGLTGFVGVDLVVGDEGVFVIEVNPRITIPLIALKEISSQNIGELLIDVVEKDKQDIKLSLNGFASFSKITVPSYIGKQVRYEKVAGIDGVLSPPIPIGNNSHNYALIMGLGNDIIQARKDYQKVKNQVLETLSA